MINKQYLNLVREVYKKGYSYSDPNRKGVMRKQIDHATLRVDFEEVGKIPMIHCKKTFPLLALTEMFLFVGGRTNIEEYREAGINFWDDDLERFNKEVGDKDNKELIGTYGDLMRRWGFGDGIDQIKELVESLKENPNQTKKTVTMWNPGELAVLTPCHFMFQLMYNSETKKLSLKWHQHSCDLFLGIPMNYLYYSTLLHCICLETGLRVGSVIGDLSNVHLYDNSFEEVENMLKDNSRWSIFDRNLVFDLRDSKVFVGRMFKKMLLGKSLGEDYKDRMQFVLGESEKSRLTVFGIPLWEVAKKEPKYYKVKMLTYDK